MNYDFCIVGAGPTGLTLAYELGKTGFSVLVIDRASRCGGLSKSYNYDGNIFDIGPKRFHTDDPKVVQFIDHVLSEKKLIIGRLSKVFFLNRYYEWPITTKELLNLPVDVAVKCVIDLIKEKEFTELDSFPSYIKYKYGTTLYKLFFQPYTEKFLRIEANDIHADWASTGINRTIIDKKAKGNSLTEMFKTLLLPKKVDTKFIYPSDGGFGGFWDTLTNLCRASGHCEFIFSDTISNLSSHVNGFDVMTRNGKSFHCNYLCWSGNINDLIKIINKESNQNDINPMAKIKYLNTIFYNIVVDAAVVPRHRAQWIYVSKGDSLISRITCMREFAPYTCKDGDYNIICEVTDSQANPLYWDSANSLTDRVIQELVDMKFLRKASNVKSVYINPQQDTYPIYHKDYLKDFAYVRHTIRKYSDKIILLGRSGAFWYNNSDHSIRMALDTAEYFLGKRESLFDHRSYFGGRMASNNPQGTETSPFKVT